MVKNKHFYSYLHYLKREEDDDEELEHGWVRNDHLEGFEGKKIEDLFIGMKVTALKPAVGNSKEMVKWQGKIVDFDGKSEIILLSFRAFFRKLSRMHSLA